MNLRRFLSCAAAAALVGVTAASPASAAVASKADPAGDVEPRYDILRVTYRNGPTDFVTRVRLDNLRRDVANGFQIVVRPANDRQRIIVAGATRRPGGSVKTEMWTIKGPDLRDLPCKMTTTWMFAEDVARLSLPQTCLRRWAGRQTGVVTMTVNPADQVEQDETVGIAVSRG